MPACTKEHGLAFLIAYNWHRNLKLFFRINIELVSGIAAAAVCNGCNHNLKKPFQGALAKSASEYLG